MNINDEIKRVVKDGTPEDALLLASSIPQARTPEVFSVISENPETSFKALKYIETAKNNLELVMAAASVPSQARVILEDIGSLRNNDTVLKSAIDNDPYWANYYLQKFEINKTWVKSLAKKFNKRPDLELL